MGQLAWTSPVSNRLLLEAQIGLGPDAWFGDKQRKEGYNPELIEVQENAGSVPGIAYRGQDAQRNYGYLRTYSASLSYVTGAHRFKAGARQQRTNASFISYYNNHRLRYVFNNGVPASFTMYGNHAVDNPFEMYTTALYAQDQWTMNRLTLQGGLRFEHIGSWYPEARFPSDLYIPDGVDVPGAGCRREPEGYQRRGSVARTTSSATARHRSRRAWDAIRPPTIPTGPYGFLQQPAFRVATNTTRGWNDFTFPVGDPRRGNFRPDCVLTNQAAHDECGGGNPNFGKSAPFQTFDPNVLSGWNVREYSWDMSVGVQQEVAPRTSVEVTYVRRSWGNHTVTDNRAYSAADYDRFSLTAPSDSRLPDGGGYRVDGLYELKADRTFGLLDNFITHAKNFGDGIGETYNGVDVNVNARLASGPQLQGGFNIGQSARNECDVVSQVPESLTVFGFRTPEQFCDIASGWKVSVGGLASYVVPKTRRAGVRDGPEPPVLGCELPGHRLAEPGGELAGVQRAGHPGAWAAARWQRPVHLRERGRTGHALRRPHHAGGHESVEDPAVRREAGEHRC